MRGLWILGIGLFPSLAFAQDKPMAQIYEIPIYSNGKSVRVERVKVTQPQHKSQRRIPKHSSPFPKYSSPFKFNGKTYYWMFTKK
jgi:hypothetical protein